LTVFILAEDAEKQRHRVGRAVANLFRSAPGDEWKAGIKLVLIGSWMAALLYGLVINQTFQYFKMYPEDTRLRKAIVLLGLFISSVELAGEFADVYLPTVTYWGNTVAIQKQYWPAPVYVISNSFTGAIVNTVLIHRFYSLSRNLWVSLVCGVFVLVGIAGSLVVGMTLHIFSAYSASNKAKVSALIWLIATATGGKWQPTLSSEYHGFTEGTRISDISIAAALHAFSLLSFLLILKATRHRRLIQRLVIGAIQTGSTTSTVAILTLVTFLINEGSNVPTGFHFLIGPLYMLTLLYNFNLRQHDAVSGSSRSRERMGPDTDGNHMSMDRIQVHRTEIVTVRIDAPDTDTPRSVETVSYGEERMKNDPDVESLGTKKVRVPDF
ncbi:hypothetical protein B0H14DRAFT_3661281, partial [Mycena olivaceomarginata]